MSNNVADDEQESKAAILSAIESLLSRGCDINPYSVSTECHVSRSEIMRNSNLLALIAQARSANGHTGNDTDEDNGTVVPEKLTSDQVHELQEQLVTSLTDNKALQQQLDRLSIINESLQQTLQARHAESEDLRADYDQLANELDNLHVEYEKLAQTLQLAWQQGYAVGQANPATVAENSFAESLPECAQSGTTFDTINNAADELSNLPFVAEAIHIDDPEILNDPFTAKLLNALQADADIAELPQQQVPVASYENEYMSTSDEPASPHEKWMEQALTDQSETITSIPGFTPEQIAEAHLAASQGEITQNFTAEDLHTLFRNRYVKEEEPEVKEAAPPAAATMTGASSKKFVGTNRSSSDPLPALPRTHPPEIRKASRLLGLNLDEAILTRATVFEAWKREMAKPGVHPDTGGDTEMAIYLNTAKDTLIRYVDDLAPKLGKKLGGQQTKEHLKHQQNKQE